MSRLLFAADLALDDPFVGLADVTVDVAQVLRDAAAGTLEAVLRVASAQGIGTVVLLGELARAGGSEPVGLRQLAATLRAWHEATGGVAVCVPATEDGTLAWPDLDAGAGIVILRPGAAWPVAREDGIVLRRRRNGGVEVEVLRAAGAAGDGAGAGAAARADVGAGAAALTLRCGPSAAAGPADAAGSRTVTVAPAQPRVALPAEHRGGAAIVELQPVGGGTPLPAAVRFVDVERVRVLDRTVEVPAAGDGVLAAIATALAQDAEAAARSLPHRWLVARAHLAGDVATRQLLATGDGVRDALYAARVTTAERGVPLWWERIETVARPDAAALGAGAVAATSPVAVAVDGAAVALSEQASTVVADAAGALDASLPFDLTVVDPATVRAARDLLLDLLRVEVEAR